VPQAFYTTVVDATAEQVLTWHARRWALKVTFQEAKGHLGFEEPQGWTRRAVEQIAPTAMLLNSLMVVWFAREGHRHLSFPSRPWYRQKHPASFADVLTTLRRECLWERFFLEPRPPARVGEKPSAPSWSSAPGPHNCESRT